MVIICRILVRRAAYLLLAVVLSASGALADGKINVDKNRIAIKGYDPVAYFTESKPVRGKPEYKTKWHDASWMFSSAENLDKFKGDPDKYSPRYGGFCALAVASGRKADIDPTAWSIVNGRLYLNYNRQSRESWREHTAENIDKADRKWPTMN